MGPLFLSTRESTSGEETDLDFVAPHLDCSALWTLI